MSQSNTNLTNLIDDKKIELMKIINDYIDKNCVEFKQNLMKKLFSDKINKLAEKMTKKYEPKEPEGKIYNNSNKFDQSNDNHANPSNKTLDLSNKSQFSNLSIETNSQKDY